MWSTNDKAAGQIAGATSLLATQGISLDLTQVPVFPGLGEPAAPSELKNDGDICDAVFATTGGPVISLLNRRAGVVLLMVPFSGSVCGGHGLACYHDDIQAMCPGAKVKRIIIVGQFIPDDIGVSSVAHELGHHALGGMSAHRDFEPGDYMAVTPPRTYFDNGQLEKVCPKDFNFF